MVMMSPRKIEVEITPRCNLRCSYCCHFASEGDVSRELPLDEWEQFFTECGNNGVMNIHLSGGEPFIRKDILDIVQSIVDNKMRFGCNSNGNYITDEIATFIACTKRCNVMQISLDGHTPDVHDALRGSGSFEKAVEAIKLLRSKDVPVGVRVTIHKNNVAFLEEIADFILTDLGLPSFGTNSVEELGLMKENHHGIALDVHEYSLAMQTLVDLNRKYDNRIVASAGPLADARMWQKMVDAADAGSAPFNGCGTLNSCGCVNATLSVRADGHYVPCYQLECDSIGRINSDSLSDVWQRNNDMNSFRNRNRIKLTDFEMCRSCDYHSYCRGGCPATISSQQGGLYVPSTIDCLKTFLRNGGVLPSLETLEAR